MKEPKRIDLNLEEVDALLERAAGLLEKGDYEIIKGMADTIRILSQAVDEKASSIRRLLRMLFGATTEKAKNVLETSDKEEDSDESKTSSGKSEDDPEGKKEKPGKKRKGHGRNGASDYTGADKISVPNTGLKSRDPCPECLKGKVYKMAIPKVVVRIAGNAPLAAKVYEMEKLRCNLCGQVFTAKEPDNIGDEKYNETAGTMIALLKYGSGFPFNRLEGLQDSLGIPLPASTQWDIVERTGDRIHPVFRELIKQAAQGEVIYNDDTTMKILALMKENNEDESSRKGMFTTGMLSMINDRKIALFFTGRKHAGENMADLLEQRQSGLSPPIQMCDALSRNVPKDFRILLANCLAHGRRKFVDVAWNFPEKCQYVIETLGQVYKNDEIAKDKNMSPAERLLFHQAESGPLMEQLKTWLNEQIDENKVEPNSGLGQAISYMLKHWGALTLFLREPNAPLDNNLCEQAIKKAILHRKNALFYKTEHGAYVGDMFMSIIHTCNLAGVNPFDYITDLQKHSSEVFKNPRNWMPWNYKAMVPSITE
ncbi:MAG: IS66 family transposase [Deltaproteobacteria bacterium]|nr:IS66 family transposase [Deltaproteobacteria bacterium]